MSSVNHRLFQVFHRFRQMPFSVLLPDEISGNEFTTLMCIGHVGDKDGETAISISALAKKLRVTTPAVSRTMRSLEKKGLIYRETDSKDRRNTFVRLTDTGKKILKQSELEMNDLVEAALLNMKQEDVERLLDYLDEFQTRMQTELEKRKKRKESV